ncbi:MAG: hypothetical protein O7G85_16145 [Planctomycetota bacterium]|nr:hypothetical protein [Planctomycetota bacterium]
MGHRCDRREFIAGASASAIALAMHDQLAFGFPSQDPVVKAASPGEARFRTMRLHTAADLGEMKQFYQGLLGFEVLDEQDGEITFKAGLTKLTYMTTTKEYDRPWYHVAFNIPENKLWKAREWQLQRTPLKQRSPGSMTHPDYPDVANFWKWNAESVFFWDPANNLLEYIARHDLDNAAPGEFTSKDILYASELGFMVEDAPGMAKQVEKALSLNPYREGNARLTPVGDEYGLLLIFGKGHHWRMSDGSTRPTDVYPAQVTIQGAKPMKYEFEGYPYRVEVV